MKWFEARIETTQAASDAVAEILTSAGANGVAIEDPFDIRQVVNTPGSLDYADEEYLESLGDVVTIKAYFSSLTDRNKLYEQLRKELDNTAKYLDTGKNTLTVTEVDEEDWSENWKKYYKTFKLTGNIIIKPSWEDDETELKGIVVEMDPGMAFGTGTHDTTRMCAELLERYIKDGDTVIDLGCGSGILSIIAAKLGAKSVTAIDIDPVAVKVASENCGRNSVNGIVECRTGVIDDLANQKADMLVANIVASVIIDISDRAASHILPGGLFITSGIIRGRRQDVLEACESRGFVPEAELQSGEWVAIAFRCRDSF